MELELRDPRIWGVSAVVLLLVLYPWILIVSVTSVILGFYSLEVFEGRLFDKFFKKNGATGSSGLIQVASDPLLHTGHISDQKNFEVKSLTPDARVGTVTISVSRTHCAVCGEENCTRDGTNYGLCVNKNCPRSKTPSPTNEPVSIPVGLTRERTDIKIPLELDKVLARFCTTIFDFYICSSWAPYETRKSLKVAFKRLLTTFAEKVQKHIFSSEEKKVDFCKAKLFPLCFYYLNTKINLEDETKARTKLRVRQLCRNLLQQVLREEDQKCRLWMELCISVLGDGVLWNLILLGGEQIPILIKEQLLENAPVHDDNDLVPVGDHPSGVDVVDGHDGPSPSSTKPRLSRQYSNSSEKVEVSFLLDSFLDSKNDMEQPDFIVSRWRPTLQDILNERDLLYCLIQYLRNHNALEYLQAVLDESHDAKDYCRQILEMEYLAAFCRSSLFLESMGISRVEEAFEVSTDGSTTRRMHSRSSSYGSSNSFLRIERSVVEGLPIYSNNLPDSEMMPFLEGQGFNIRGTMETDSLFGRRQHTMNSFIQEFMKSTSANRHPALDSLEKPPPVRKTGIESRSYEDTRHPDITSTVSIGGCDVYSVLTQMALSWIKVNSWADPVISGWLQFTKPYTQPHFDAMLDKKLREVLTLDLFIYLVNLVCELFVIENIDSSVPLHTEWDHSDSKDSSMYKTFVSLIRKLYASKFIDSENLDRNLHDSQDNLILFFVDVLNIFVTEISSHS